MQEILEKLTEGKNIEYGEAERAMRSILEGKASPVETSAYLTALKMKGETAEEIIASAKVMYSYGEKLECSRPVLEVVGTGGDRSGSFNISTMSAIIASAAGIRVAKHGNRAYTSRCGAADVMEALGYNLELPAAESLHMLEETGFCFLFAQKYNKAAGRVSSIRKELGFRTIFNTIGPLCNPANPGRILLGVYKPEMVPAAAQVLAGMGAENAMVVYGMDGMDEISVSAPTKICEYKNGRFYEEILYPEMLGVSRWNKKDIVGGDPLQNAEIIRNVLAGETGARRDITIVNAAAAIYTGNCFSVTMKEAVETAKNCIDSGRAAAWLDKIIRFSGRTGQKNKKPRLS